MNRTFQSLLNLGVVTRVENPDDDYYERFDLRLEPDNAFFSLEDLQLLKNLFKPDKLSFNYCTDYDSKDEQNALFLEFWYKEQTTQTQERQP